jgi:hypothetical protein
MGLTVLSVLYYLRDPAVLWHLRPMAQSDLMVLQPHLLDPEGLTVLLHLLVLLDPTVLVAL